MAQQPARWNRMRARFGVNIRDWYYEIDGLDDHHQGLDSDSPGTMMITARTTGPHNQEKEKTDADDILARA
jgi:hypothetical protein